MRLLLAVAIAVSCFPSRAFASPRAYEFSDPAIVKAYAAGSSIDLRRGGSNYFAFNFCDMRQGCRGGETRELGWIKFRIDLEYDIFRKEQKPQRGYWYVTFPLRLLSFWDVFSLSKGAESAPFIETNYSPGLELTWAMTPELASWVRRVRPLLSAGFRHESNGLGKTAFNDQQETSRSWNQVYGAVVLLHRVHDRVSFYHRAEGWGPVWSDAVAAWGGKRIENYAGYFSLHSEARLDLGKWAKFMVAADVRQRSFQFELRWNLKGERSARHDTQTDGAQGEPASCEAEDTYTLVAPLAADGGPPPGRQCKAAKQARPRAGGDNFFRLDLVAQCFFGRAERLSTADETRRSCYAGFGF